MGAVGQPNRVAERSNSGEGDFPRARLAAAMPLYHVRRSRVGIQDMKLYRVDKLAKLGGMVIKKKHILASSDRQAVKQAEESPDCPICDVVADNGQKVGQVL